MEEEFLKSVKNNKDVQKEIKHEVQKYSEQNLNTKNEIGKTMLIQNNVYKKAMYLMGDTIADMDEEIEIKDNKINYLENKIGMTDKEVVKEMKNKGIKLTEDKSRKDRILNRLKRNCIKHNMLAES